LKFYLAACSAVLMAGSAASALAQAPAPALSMTCHESLRGVPMKEGTVYEVVGKEMYNTGMGGRVQISTEDKPLFLAKADDNGVPVESFASHTVNGSVVTRTVYWRKPGGPMQQKFTEQYDFKARTIVSSADKTDRCHGGGR
jgi:opacity protein-like surface antigen